MKVVLTGVCGFAGSTIAAGLLEARQGLEIIGVDNLSRPGSELNRLIVQNMLDKGHDKVQAEGEIGLLAHLLRYLGHGKLSVKDGPDTLRLGLNFALSQ